MLFRAFALTAIAAASFSAQATLTVLPNGWPPAGSQGLAGVLFNVVTANGVTAAMGAHAYKNSSFLANNGVDTFYADLGTYAPDGKNYANWSFDFAFDLGSCTACQAFLRIDTNPGSGVSFTEINLSTLGYGSVSGESWNMEMPFLAPIGFDPFANSSTAFELVIRGAAGGDVMSAITVDAGTIPEPSSLALVGLALVGAGALRRRSTKA